MRRTAAVLLCGAATAGSFALRGADAGSGQDPTATERASAVVELGRRLFFDPAVGRRGRVGCADCHAPEHGFSDERDRSVDENGKLPRHSQPVVDLGGAGFHWDGEFDTVRQVIDARVLPSAQAMQARAQRGFEKLVEAKAAGREPEPSPGSLSGYGGPPGGDFPEAEFVIETTPIAQRLATEGRYDSGFRLAFGDPEVTPQRIGDALEAYLASLRTSTNAVDRRLAGDANALSDSAERGLELFRGRAQCSQCHLLEGGDGRAPLTDGQFHNTGVAARQAKKAAGSGGEDTGRQRATRDLRDAGAFKTPSLRDVARRDRLMHDAAFATLREVVDYYDRGGTPNEHLDPRIRRLDLSQGEKDDLVALLERFTGEKRAGIGPITDAHQATLEVRVEGIDGNPLPSLPLTVRASGDRLGTAPPEATASRVVTDGDGIARVAFPSWTHVRIEADGYTLGISRPIPDWTRSTTLVATPRRIASIVVRCGGALHELPNELTLDDLDENFEFVDGKLVTSMSHFHARLFRARRISGDAAIYVGSTSAGGPRPMILNVPGNSEPLGVFEVDLHGGASEPIDLAHAERLRPGLTRRTVRKSDPK